MMAAEGQAAPWMSEETEVRETRDPARLAGALCTALHWLRVSFSSESLSSVFRSMEAS
jgi:hypothetical protein